MSGVWVLLAMYAATFCEYPLDQHGVRAALWLEIKVTVVVLREGLRPLSPREVRGVMGKGMEACGGPN